MSDTKHRNDKPECNTCPLGDCLVKHCTTEWKTFFNQAKLSQRFKRKQHIFYEGNAVNGVYFVCDGVVKVYKNGVQEKCQIIRFSKSGEILGHRGWRKSNLPISAAAVTDTIVSFISNEDWEQVLRNNPELVFALMEFYSDELFHSEIKMKNMSLLNVYEKLGDALLSLEQKFGRDADGFIKLVLSRKEIAEYAGTTEKQVSKILSEFNHEKVISLEGKKIGLLNHFYLRNLIKGNVLVSQ